MTINRQITDIVSYTRASSATRTNASGAVETVAAGTPRIDFNPSTLAIQGLLVEPQRTNMIRNSTMQGAVAGTPGTLPTNWSVATGGLTGITQQIIGTGIESGITYLDIRFSGTPSAPGTYRIYTEGTANVAALTGQTWSNSQYLKLAAGTLTGVTGFTDVYQEFTAAGGFVTEAGVVISSPTTSALATQRSTTSRTLAGGATVAFVRSGLQLTLSGVAIDITLRIGLPQLELGDRATSPILSSGVATTRAADSAHITGSQFSSRYIHGATTLYADFIPSVTQVGSVVLSANDGTINNATRISIQEPATTGAIRAWASDGVRDVLAVDATANVVRFDGVDFLAGATTTPFNARAVAVRSANEFLIAGTNGQYAITTNGGATWTTYQLDVADRTTINGAAFGNGTYVIAGNAQGGSGLIATVAADGTYQRRVSGVAVGFEKVRFLNGAFYTVTSLQNNTLTRSLDGVTWSTISATANGQNLAGYDIAFGNNTYVACGGNGRVSTSSDGLAFSNSATGVTTQTLNSVAFSSGIFVSVGNAGSIITSTNGTTWTARASGTTANLLAVIYSTRDACWYAAGDGGVILRSDDGITWTQIDGDIYASVTVGGVVTAKARLGKATMGISNRVALRVNTGSIAGSLNGQTVRSVNTTVPVPTQLSLGMTSQATLHLIGWLRRFDMVRSADQTTPQTDAQLQVLTA